MKKSPLIPFKSMLNNDPDYDWNNEQVFDSVPVLRKALERYMRDSMLASEDLIYVYTHDNRVISSDRSIDFHVPNRLRIFK
ncbi:MAG: hypothetical protein JHC33_01965 [Ignisphaera sp.]|nr:hypothetical protein [Ignisphaera sp.]